MICFSKNLLGKSFSFSLSVKLGICVGLSAALLFCFYSQSRQREALSYGQLLADSDGAFDKLVIHYVPEAASVVVLAYRQFLMQLETNVIVYVVCSNAAAFEHFIKRVGDVPCVLEPVIVNHIITPWSRDRWLSVESRFDNSNAEKQAILVAPKLENGAAIWPQRAGDAKIPFDIAEHLPRQVSAVKSNLAFDGGDFVADARTIVVSPNVLSRNMGKAVGGADELTKRLEQLLHKKVVLLKKAPSHHVGMYLMLVGNNTALVGDPFLARESYLSSGSSQPLTTDKTATSNAKNKTDLNVNDSLQPDWSIQTQQHFDAVANQLTKQGFKVLRMPTVPYKDGRTYITYLNAVIERVGNNKIVYMPHYQHQMLLNRDAKSLWRKLGYTVRAVDCTQTYRHFGSLRCLVNVLTRKN